MDSHEAEITAVLKAQYQETENADSVLVTVCVFDLLNSAFCRRLILAS